MDLLGELERLEPKPTDIWVFRCSDDQVQSPQFRDVVGRISRTIEERLGWRPVIITLSEGCDLGLLPEEDLAKAGLMRTPVP